MKRKRGEWNDDKTKRFWNTLQSGKELWLTPGKFEHYKEVGRKSSLEWHKENAWKRDRTKDYQRQRNRELIKKHHNTALWHQRTVNELKHHVRKGRDVGDIAIRLNWPVSDVKAAIAKLGPMPAVDPLDCFGRELIRRLDEYADKYGSWHLDDDVNSIAWANGKPHHLALKNMKFTVDRAREHFDRVFPRKDGDLDWGIWRAAKDSRNFKPKTT